MVGLNCAVILSARMGLPTTILSLLPLREFVNSHEMCQMGRKFRGKWESLSADFHCAIKSSLWLREMTCECGGVYIILKLWAQVWNSEKSWERSMLSWWPEHSLGFLHKKTSANGENHCCFQGSCECLQMGSSMYNGAGDRACTWWCIAFHSLG